MAVTGSVHDLGHDLVFPASPQREPLALQMFVPHYHLIIAAANCFLRLHKESGINLSVMLGQQTAVGILPASTCPAADHRSA